MNLIPSLERRMNFLKNLDDYYPVQCPYCFSSIEMMIDYTAGDSQSFVYDCEVCCQPILIKVAIKNQTVVRLDAEKES